MPSLPGKPRRQLDKRYPSGLPILNTKIDPEALNWITSRPEGTRAYLERLVAEDKARAVSRPAPAGATGPVETQQVEIEQWTRFERGRSIQVALGEIPPTENEPTD